MTTSTITEWLDDIEGKFGDLPALEYEGDSTSFEELARRSRGLAAGLAARGVGKGDRVAIWLLNQPDWLTSFFACAQLGAIAVAVNTRFRAKELADIFDRARPTAIVSNTRFRSIDFSALISQAAKLSGTRPELVISTDAKPAGSAIPLDDLIGSSGSPTVETVDAECAAIMFTTSGTTSAPKFAMHPQRSIVDHAQGVARDFAMDAASAVMLQALPYCGVFGFCQAMASLQAGRPSIVQDVFDPAEAADAITRHGVTHFNATDEMLMALVSAAPGCDFSSLRLVGAASFNRGPETLAALADAHDLPIVGLYGMSEVQALFARRAIADPPADRYRAGGRPVADRAGVRVCNPESGDVLPPGEFGELELAGPSLFGGYFGDAKATAEAIRPDGYVRTGDLGILAEDGSFTFEARMGDALRLGGFLVNPDEISGFIKEIDGIEECVVVGVDLQGRLKPAAFVIPQLNQSIDTQRILDACNRELAPFKVPAIVHVLHEFPVADGPNGVKVQRGVLRKLASELVEK